jgi:hypothetical protein
MMRAFRPGIRGARRTGTVVLAVVALCAGVAAPSASAATAFWASGVGPIYSGNSWVNIAVHEVWFDLEVNSTGTAYSGVWTSEFSGGTAYRTSGDYYCSDAPGCAAYHNWSPGTVTGYPTLHNHGNASPSYFSGYGTY